MVASERYLDKYSYSYREDEPPFLREWDLIVIVATLYWCCRGVEMIGKELALTLG